MSDEQNEGGVEEMSADDAAYFESGGEVDAPEANGQEQVSAETDETHEEHEASGEEQPQQEKQATVPHQALHAEREKTKAVRNELTAANERIAVMEDRLNRVLEAMNAQSQQQQPQPQEEEPSWDDDPYGRMISLDKRVKAMQEQQAEAEQRRLQEFHAAQEFQMKFNHVNSAAMQIAESDPSFNAAIDFIGDSFEREAKTLYGMSHADAQQHRNAMIQSHIAHMYDTRVDVGEYIRNLAQFRGFQAPSQSAAPANKAAEEASRIAAQAAASDKHRSLSQAGGTTPTPQNGVDILAMSDEEFARWHEKASEAEIMRAYS